MLGLLVFLLLVIAFTSINALTDRGVAERRKIKLNYGYFLEEMAVFEQTGGYLQEFDQQAADVRRMTRRSIIWPWVLALVLTIGMTWLGFTVWIPATLVALYVVAIGALAWLVSDLFGVVDGRGPRSKIEITGALSALVLKGVIVAGGIFVATQGVGLMNTGNWISGIALTFFSIALLTYCYLPVGSLDRHFQKLKGVDFATTTKTDAVLFLRSFDDDNLRLFSPYGPLGPRYRFVPGRKRFEEVLTATLIGFSELVSVGKPGEKVPLLGASRTYWDQDSWKEAIKSTASRTAGLLVLAGKTPSLGWEMAQISELGLLGKSLILFPPDNDTGTIERYAYINEALHFEPQHKLPDGLKLTLVGIAFDRQGRPVHYLSGGRDWSSCVAMLIHYQMVLQGTLAFDAEGAVSQAVANADDPYEQARYLLEAGKRNRAELILSRIEGDPSDVPGLIGRAWERAAFHQDYAGARQLIHAPSVDEVSPMLQRALAALDAAELDGDCRKILQARYPDRFQNRSGRVRLGITKLDRMSVLRFQRLMQRIGSAEDTQDLEAAFNYSRDLLEFAESKGISTLIALAQVQLGDTEFERGNLERATALFQEAATLREAPSIKLSPLLPRLEPSETVEEALTWLVRVADHENNADKRNEALKELLEFRTEYAALEGAAWAAEELGRSYADSGDLETAKKYFHQARTVYTQVGRLSQAGWTILLQAKAEQQDGDAHEALRLLEQATKVAEDVEDLALRFETSRLAGDLQEKLANETSSEDLLRQARTSYESALDVAREAVEIAAEQQVPGSDEFRQSQLNLSIALNDLGNFIGKTDAGGAQPYLKEALGIRRILVEEDPEDYWIARRLGFSLLFLAINRSILQNAEGPETWIAAVSLFSKLTENQKNSESAATDFSLAIDQFVKNLDASESRVTDLEALASAGDAIQEALQRIVEHAPPGEAYAATRAIFGLASEFNDVSMRSSSYELFVAILSARRRLSGKYFDNQLFRRGIAFSLLSASTQFSPEALASTLSGFREARSILEDLAASADSNSSTSAQDDLIFGLMYAATNLSEVSKQMTHEFASRAAEVAENLVVLEPNETRWKRKLARARKLCADAVPKSDTATALRGYQAVLDLDVTDGYPAQVRWAALKDSGGVLGDTNPTEAARFYCEAIDFTKAQLKVHPGDTDWEWRLGRSLVWLAESETQINPTNALSKWREFIELQKRRLPNYQEDLKELRLLAVALHNAGELVGSEDAGTAAALYREADRYFRDLCALEPSNPKRFRDVVENSKGLAELLSKVRQPTLRDESASIWIQVRTDIQALAMRTGLTCEDVELLQKAQALGGRPS